MLPVWGAKQVQDIARRDVIELLDRLVDAGKPVLANRTLAHVRKFFNWCIERSILAASPCVRITAPAEEKSRDLVLSDSEMRLVWKASERIGFPFGPFVQLLTLTAQRRDEVAGARRRELHDGGKLWTISGDANQERRPARCASEQFGSGDRACSAPHWARRVPVLHHGRDSISGYSNAKERLDATMLAIAREQAEVRGENPEDVKLEPWRLHDLRRTAASGMARLGVPVHVIEAVLNHRSGQISGVAAVYNRHSYLPEKRRALEAWAGFVLSLMEEHNPGNVQFRGAE